MTKKDSILLFVLALVFYSLFATIQKEPGYMDAEYYFGQALRIAHGNGLSEPFVWNYLSNPQSLPVPGFGFWMPLTSIISAAALWIAPSDSFFVARIPFIIMAALLPLISSSLAYHLSHQRRSAWLAGGVTIAAGYYLPYITITDNFLPYMLLGGSVFLTLYHIDLAGTKKRAVRLSIVAGVIVGLMCLTRSDGMIWIITSGAGLWLSRKKNKLSNYRILNNLCFFLIGVGIVFTPWMVRNYFIYQNLFPPANGRMLWLTNYDDLFVYPASEITFSGFWSMGVGNLLFDRLRALGSNIQTLVASGGNIFLFPLILLGWWKYRKELISKTTTITFLSILFVMSIFFPYAGERGGFFHSLSSIQLFLWALVPMGLEVVIRWGIAHRKWKLDRSWRMFGTAIMVVSLCLSVFLVTEKIRNGVENGIPWNQSSAEIKEAEMVLQRANASTSDVIMTNNPPAAYLYTGRSAVMIPTGGSGAILNAADLFKVRYLTLNEERQEIKELFAKDEQLKANFGLIYDKEGLSVYEYQP